MKNHVEKKVERKLHFEMGSHHQGSLSLEKKTITAESLKLLKANFIVSVKMYHLDIMESFYMQASVETPLFKLPK